MVSMLQNSELYQHLTGVFEKSELLMSLFPAARSLCPRHPYFIGAGCLVQTVWNELTNRPPEYGIGDIDIIYYDGTDLSLAAEEAVVSEGQRLLSGLRIPVDIKNEARVHLWYRDKFGIELQQYASLEAAIDTWPATATSLGARLNPDGSWHIYAPFGLEDLFNLVVRPNKVLINESIYNQKARKWKSKWPELSIIPWKD